MQYFKYSLLLLFFCLIECTTTPSNIPRELKVHFIDVGQGDATLIQMPGNQNILVDGGDIPGIKLQEYLINELGIDHLNAVIITHEHQDHYGGMYNILSLLDIDVIYYNGTFHKTLFQNLLDSITSKNIPQKPLLKGYNIINNEDIIIEVLYPDSTFITTWDTLLPNKASIILKISYNEFDFLLTGDIREEEEYKLADEFKYDLKCEVLKVSHHGSKTSTTDSILKYINPDYAVISAGIDNDYNHPDSTIINRLSNIGSQILRTDQDGTIIFKFDGSSLILSTIK